LEQNSRPWRSWIRTGFGLAVWLFWLHLAIASVEPRSSRTLAIVASFLIVAGAWGIAYLPNRPLWPLKLIYAVSAALVFRHFNLFHFREDVPTVVFSASVLFLLTILSEYREECIRQRQPWWPAVKRTARRLRGDWQEDNAGSAERVFGGKKQ